MTQPEDIPLVAASVADLGGEVMLHLVDETEKDLGYEVSKTSLLHVMMTGDTDLRDLPEELRVVRTLITADRATVDLSPQLRHLRQLRAITERLLHVAHDLDDTPADAMVSARKRWLRILGDDLKGLRVAADAERHRKAPLVVAAGTALTVALGVVLQSVGHWAWNVLAN